MKSLLVGLVWAAFCWFMMFASFVELPRRIHEEYFWYAMVFSTLSLTAYTLWQQRGHYAKLFAFEPRFVLIGLVHAVLLYGLSRLGVYLMTHLFEWSMPQIQAVYQTRTQLNPVIIAPLLFFIIAPAEEIFWRGFVQQRLSRHLGAMKGWLLTAGLYAVVHIWALNPMLLIAAIVLGVHWGLLYKRYNSLVPGIVSHALWDTTIFVLLPVQF